MPLQCFSTTNLIMMSGVMHGLSSRAGGSGPVRKWGPVQWVWVPLMMLSRQDLDSCPLFNFIRKTSNDNFDLEFNNEIKAMELLSQQRLMTLENHRR